MGWPDTSDGYILYTAIGAIVLCFGLLDKFLREYLFLTEIGVAVLVGVMLGNSFSIYSVIEPGTWLVGTDTIALLAQVARFTLAIQLMTTALQSPDFYYIKTWRVLFILLVPVMTLTFAFSGLIAWGILGMGVNVGFLVGEFVAPTGESTLLGGVFFFLRLPAHIFFLLSLSALSFLFAGNTQKKKNKKKIRSSSCRFDSFWTFFRKTATTGLQGCAHCGVRSK